LTDDNIAARLNGLVARGEACGANPMCTTLTAALVWRDCAVVQWVGDSPAYLYQAATDSLLRLNVEHNLSREPGERISDSDGGGVLTRVAGGVWSESERKCLPRRDTPSRVTVCLAPGDALLLASDGLPNGLAPMDERGSLARIGELVRTALRREKPAAETAKMLAHQADAGQSSDNITVNVLLVVGNRDNREEKHHG
ncbi:MAG TPA: SpoIIE family protein phosphatase, partial [Candidatus Hydrogenedentes bacterium]|nr:SpoIIE family protein phosphatase [Candidatus Hydrogenedentota bacterium]